MLVGLTTPRPRVIIRTDVEANDYPFGTWSTLWVFHIELLVYRRVTKKTWKHRQENMFFRHSSICFPGDFLTTTFLNARLLESNLIEHYLSGDWVDARAFVNCCLMVSGVSGTLPYIHIFWSKLDGLPGNLNRTMEHPLWLCQNSYWTWS